MNHIVVNPEVGKDYPEKVLFNNGHITGRGLEDNDIKLSLYNDPDIDAHLVILEIDGDRYEFEITPEMLPKRMPKFEPMAQTVRGDEI